MYTFNIHSQKGRTMTIAKTTIHKVSDHDAIRMAAIGQNGVLDTISSSDGSVVIIHDVDVVQGKAIADSVLPKLQQEAVLYDTHIYA